LWIDDDLVSAYTTGMVHMSLPEYYNGSLIEPGIVYKLTNEQLLNGYLIVNGDFNFTTTVKYPSIPCYIDKSTTVYL